MRDLLKKLKKDVFLPLSVLIHLLIFILAIIFSDATLLYEKPLKYIEITEIESPYIEKENDAKRLAKHTHKAKKEKAPDDKYKNYEKPSPKQYERKFSKKTEEKKAQKDKELGDLKKFDEELKKEDNIKEAKVDSPQQKNSIFKPQLSVPNSQTEATVELNTKEFKYISYFLKIKRKIQMVWSYPRESYNKAESGKVLVVMSVDKTGKLISVSILKSSGFKRLDEGAKSAIITAAPYPPFPKSWKYLKKLNIKVLFAYMPGTWNFR